MAVSNLNVLTQAHAEAASADLVGKAFSKLLLVSASTKSVFGKMEGPEGAQLPILVKTDLSKGRAQKVNFSVSANSGFEPVKGEGVLEGNEEELDVNSFSVTVDFTRHAIGLNEKVKQFLAAGMSLEEAYSEVLSDHLARVQETEMKMRLRNSAGELNTVRPNNVASIDELTSADTIDVGTLGEAKGLMTMVGGEAINVSRAKSGAEILRFLIFGTENALRPLKSDTAYAAALRDAAARGDENTIFRGGYADWDGNAIYPQNIIDADARGPIGDPFEARARLGTAITAGSTALTVTGGGLKGPDSQNRGKYFRWFFGHDFQWVENQTAAPDSNTYYFVIYNVTGADKGKFGVYSYVGTDNNGQEIDCTSRLGPGNASTMVSTLAGQTYNSSVHTQTHPKGSLVIQVNALCVPVCSIYALGKASGLRAYGSIPMKKIEQVQDYGFKKGMGYMSIFGQDVARDSENEIRNYAKIECAYRIPGVNLPVIT